MESINRIELQGVVGYSRIMQVGNSMVARFNLVISEQFRRADGTIHEETTWHSVTSWEGDGRPDPSDIVKGREVYVKGRLKQTRYTDAQGLDRSFYEVLAAEVRIVK